VKLMAAAPNVNCAAGKPGAAFTRIRCAAMTLLYALMPSPSGARTAARTPIARWRVTALTVDKDHNV
jgi:hypothetical protein